MNETTITMKEVPMQGITETITKSFSFTTESDETINVVDDLDLSERLQIVFNGDDLLSLPKEDAKKLAYCLEQFLD